MLNGKQQNFQQKTLGIIGGMSTQSYYRLIGQGVEEKLSVLHSADVLIHSVNLAPISALVGKYYEPFTRHTNERKPPS